MASNSLERNNAYCISLTRCALTYTPPPTMYSAHESENSENSVGAVPPELNRLPTEGKEVSEHVSKAVPSKIQPVNALVTLLCNGKRSNYSALDENSVPL